MKRVIALVLLSVMSLVLSGCVVFISAERLRGPVPAPEVLAAQAEAAAVPELSAEQQAQASANLDVISDIEGRVGEDLVANASFSGRETPKSAPLRGARVKQGDKIRVSASRAQQSALEAEEYCIDQGKRCSTVWVYGRVSGGTLGAWYPLVIFEYQLN